MVVGTKWHGSWCYPIGNVSHFTTHHPQIVFYREFQIIVHQTQDEILFYFSKFRNKQDLGDIFSYIEEERTLLEQQIKIEVCIYELCYKRSFQKAIPYQSLLIGKYSYYLRKVLVH